MSCSGGTWKRPSMKSLSTMRWIRASFWKISWPHSSSGILYQLQLTIKARRLIIKAMRQSLWLRVPTSLSSDSLTALTRFSLVSMHRQAKATREWTIRVPRSSMLSTSRIISSTRLVWVQIATSGRTKSRPSYLQIMTCRSWRCPRHTISPQTNRTLASTAPRFTFSDRTVTLYTPSSCEGIRSKQGTKMQRRLESNYFNKW